MNWVQKIARGGWSGFGMVTVGIDPNTFEVLNGHPNKIPTDKILGGVVQNCRHTLKKNVCVCFCVFVCVCVSWIWGTAISLHFYWLSLVHCTALIDSQDEDTGDVTEVDIYCIAQCNLQNNNCFNIFVRNSFSSLISCCIHPHTCILSCFAVQITEETAIQDFINRM